jgi:hypothetical protein
VGSLRQRVQLGTLAFVLAACQNGNGGTDEESDSSSTDETTGGGMLPPTPTLDRPADGATDLPIETELCWNLVEDPDGDELAYRVWIDDMLLTPGMPGEQQGYAGPCTGPLNFEYERSYEWKVQAFEVDAPERSSDQSETWTFTIEDDGLTKTVFEDGFEDDLGWEVTGDAAAGAWVRGTPEATWDGEPAAQPNRCTRGSSCYFTGHNAGGVVDDADVSGGRTILTSPEFDLGGAAAATVQLSRFFYKSESMSGPSLEVELLVPDADLPGAYEAFPLELLEEATVDQGANAWWPREYLGCGIPMADGSRLRITATDEGTGILEAAIDAVTVRAQGDDRVCNDGEGAFCDPVAGTDCSGEFLCCSQGVLNEGVYRCENAVAGVDFDDPPATSSTRGNGAMGCDAPDLFVDPSVIEPFYFTDIQVFDDTCVLFEGCVGGTGWRTILRFTAAVPNIGSSDLTLGVPANHPDIFDYSGCHDHFHFDEFARYELRDGNGVVAPGHKQAFCLLDTISWAWQFDLPQFDCANQGVSRGFSDWYESDLPCQWIDVTDTAPGDYTLRILLNPPRPYDALPLLNERDYGNNVLEYPATVQ